MNGKRKLIWGQCQRCGTLHDKDLNQCPECELEYD